MKINIAYDGGLERLAERIENNAGGIVSAIGERVMQSAKEACPVDTGALRDSIKMSVQGNRAVVSANTDYAGYVEFGTSKMPARPYLVPALIMNADAVSVQDIIGGRDD